MTTAPMTLRPVVRALPEPGRHDDDWDLAKAAGRGDTSAYEELYHRYVRTVYAHILVRTSDRTLAEDLTSETFLRGLRSIGSLVRRPQHSPCAWFITIARNIVLDEFKSSRRRRERLCLDAIEYDWASPEDPEALTLTESARREQCRVLALGLEELSLTQRTCLRLRFFDELSVEETARRMNRTPGAIKALQFRAIRRLNTLLSDMVVAS